MVKPDGLVTGKAAEIVDFLDNNGFDVVAVETPTLHRLHWRELWRFQLTSATLDRLAVNDLVFCRSALLLLLRHRGDITIPATVHLSVLKGVSDVAKQAPDCLRRRLGQPNRIFSFFHVADEPADLLRELGILLDSPRRRRLLAALCNEAPVSADLQTLHNIIAQSTARARDLDASTSVRRILASVEQALQNSPVQGQETLRYLQQELRQMGLDRRIAWRPFAQALQHSSIQADEWDLAMIATNYILYDEPGCSKLIVGVDPLAWLHP
jgi:hypothetical protein